MKSVLIIDDLATKLAAKGGVTQEEATRFIRELFNIAAEDISKGKPATIAGIGTFKAIDGDVQFLPDEALASTLNEPFAMFAPIEIPAGADIADVESEDSERMPTADYDITSEEAVGTSEEAVAAVQSAPTEPEEPTPAENTTTDESAEENTHATPTEESIEPTEEPREEPTEERPKKRRSLIKRIAIAAAVIALIYGAGILTSMLLEKPRVEIVEAQPIDSLKIAAEQKAKAEAIVRYDTVRSDYYFTAMAKRYYGDEAYWVYIYEENQGVLGHPERTMPGTILAIPAAEKYGIDPTKPGNIQAAQQKAFEIYARFR